MARLSEAPMRVWMASSTCSRARSAGTSEPTCKKRLVRSHLQIPIHAYMPLSAQAELHRGSLCHTALACIACPCLYSADCRRQEAAM